MSMQFSFESGQNPTEGGNDAGRGGRPGDEKPFRILVIADFGGRADRSVCEPIEGRKPVKVDLDVLEDLPATFGTRVRVKHDPVHDLALETIDGLHPDEIHDHAELFSALRDLRKRVKEPATFEAAAEEVAGWATGSPPTGSEIEPKPSATSTPESEFAALLGRTMDTSPKREAATVEALLKDIIGPYIVPDRDPRQDELIGLVNEAIAREMRSVLHSPAWMRVESAWHGLRMLVTGLELDDDLELFAMDATPEEIAAGKAALEDILVTRPVQTAGGVPWAVVLHLHQHGETDLEALETLGGLSHRAGAPLVTSAEPKLFGIERWADRPDPGDWNEPSEATELLRHKPWAEAVCVTMPRFLSRLPYGPGHDEVDRFEFDETNGSPSAESLVWGSGAVLVGLLLGGAFSQVGWSVQPVGGGTVDDLPVVAMGGDDGMIPCAEAWLSDRVAGALASRGITPLISVQNRGAVQIAGLRSLAGGGLACRW